jgi:nucleoside-diphosphate-sugar epimerase
MMDRVLVTGAGGYIGSTLVPKLLEAGHAVRAVDRFFYPPAVSFVDHDAEAKQLIRRGSCAESSTACDKSMKC